ncbi:MAG: hypothetical protein KTR31_32315 [Myxococcales bacterium]|nr:hypothetical protein [Myxococcales bacterium]
MHSIRIAALLLLPLVVGTTAHATLMTGNPGDATLKVDVGSNTLTWGSVDLDKVRLHWCGGGFTDHNVGQNIDPVAGHTISGINGDVCGMTVFWDSDAELDGDDGGTTYSLEVTATTTYVDVDPSPSPSAYGPYTVTSGSFSGQGPRLEIELSDQ